MEFDKDKLGGEHCLIWRWDGPGCPASRGMWHLRRLGMGETVGMAGESRLLGVHDVGFRDGM
jgi:hypothetical protein